MIYFSGDFIVIFNWDNTNKMNHLWVYKESSFFGGVILDTKTLDLSYNGYNVKEQSWASYIEGAQELIFISKFVEDKVLYTFFNKD